MKGEQATERLAENRPLRPKIRKAQRQLQREQRRITNGINKILPLHHGFANMIREQDQDDKRADIQNYFVHGCPYGEARCLPAPHSFLLLFSFSYFSPFSCRRHNGVWQIQKSVREPFQLVLQ